MSTAGWQEHARAAEAALARGTPDVARRELHRAIQVPAAFPSGPLAQPVDCSEERRKRKRT
jgi:hypothetical protein